MPNRPKPKARKTIAPAATDPIIRALQQAYVDAGSPTIREFAAKADVAAMTAWALLARDQPPVALVSLERIAKALGMRIVVVKA